MARRTLAAANHLNQHSYAITTSTTLYTVKSARESLSNLLQRSRGTAISIATRRFVKVFRTPLVAEFAFLLLRYYTDIKHQYR
jgi:hypothetical protein